LNQAKDVTNPLDYWGEWTDHNYTASPDNWRFPFYTLFLDRFVNGDPTNDDANNTAFEHDLNSNQMRHGGDLQGLIDTLDYIKGMGVRVCAHFACRRESLLTMGRDSTSLALPSSISHGATVCLASAQVV
jgi:hypothetical protein